MAKTDYKVGIEVDEQGAISKIDKVATSLGAADKSAKSLKQQLREMNAAIAELPQGSDEFQKLSNQAGELRDRIKDASEAINRNAGSSFEKLSNNAVGLRESLFNLDFEQVGSSLKGLAGTVQGFSFKELSGGLKDITGGFASLGKALLTNPLFLIITGVTLLVANFEKITSLFDGVTDAQQEAAVAQQASADAAKAQYDNISATENSLRVQGKSEAEILKLKKDQLDVAIAAQEAAILQNKTIRDGQVQAAERNKSILTGILNFVSAPLKFVFEQVDKAAALFGQKLGLADLLQSGVDSIATAVFDPKEIAKEGDAAIDEATKKLEQLQNTRDGFILQERSKAKAAADERKKERDAELAELRKQVETVAALRESLNAQIEKSLPGTTQERSKLINEADERLKIIEQQKQLEFELNATAQEKEIQQSDEKYIKLREQAAGNAELIKQLAILNGEEVAAIEKKYADDAVEIERQKNAAILSVSSNLFGGLADLASSFTAKNQAQARAQFAITKGLNIAQALANTYLGATSAYAQTPGGPIIKGIAAGTAIAAGLANVNRIRQQKFEGGSAGGGSGAPSVSVGGAPSGGGTGVPQFNPVNTDFTNDRPPQPTRAYVLASDTLKATEAQQKIEDQARL